MAETRFIKTVAFGGYDKSEVVRRLEYLNSQVYELRNELRETKLLLEAYKKGTDVEKAHEAVLAGERTKLTQLQVQNDTLNTKLKASDEENRGYGQKLKDAEDTIQELKDQLKETAGKLSAMETNNEAMSLSSVGYFAQQDRNSRSSKEYHDHDILELSGEYSGSTGPSALFQDVFTVTSEPFGSVFFSKSHRDTSR